MLLCGCLVRLGLLACHSMQAAAANLSEQGESAVDDSCVFSAWVLLFSDDTLFLLTTLRALQHWLFV